MADLFGEVEQDLRAEQARAAVRRYGLVAAAAVLLAAAGAGVWQTLHWRHLQADAKVSAAYFAAIQSLDGPASDPAARASSGAALLRPLAQSDVAGVRALSRLRLAQLQADAGNSAGAVTDLDALAGDPQAPRALRDLATLASVQHQLANGNPASLALRLQEIEQPDGPFRDLAIETNALIDLAGGKPGQSRHLLQMMMADENATDSIRERANTLLQAIRPAAGQ